MEVGADDVSQMVKGKRTKRGRGRGRLQSPNGGSNALMTCSSSIGAGDCGSSSSTATCNYESTEEEEEDMANCLILLARGHGSKTEKFRSRRLVNADSTSSDCKIGIFVYDCKTCNRSFPSFQALGGHRASHKKPKVDEKKSPPAEPTSLSNDEHENLEWSKINRSSPPPSLVPLSADVTTGPVGINPSRVKIHECSICGSEFSSGQALGGHMRRHRAATSTGQVVGFNVNGNSPVAPPPMTTKLRNTLELDLNLPAPEDDNRDSKFQFASTKRSLVLSAPGLVDCHY